LLGGELLTYENYISSISNPELAITLHSSQEKARFHLARRNHAMIHLRSASAIWAILLFITATHAQFQFFENMFGGGQQHQFHEQQDVASDSSWYQRTWDGGMFAKIALFLFVPFKD
jgi:hypothetical protein